MILVSYVGKIPESVFFIFMLMTTVVVLSFKPFREAQVDMATANADDSPQNFLGALIFLFYVLGALGLTALIFNNLLKKYMFPPSQYFSRRLGRASLNIHLQTFLAFSILSFSSISYHMLNFLIFSYCDWAETQGVALPASVADAVGNGVSKLQIWNWLTSSRLFLDFAKEICKSWERYFWVGQALWATLGVGVLVGSEGVYFSEFHSSLVSHIYLAMGLLHLPL